MEEEFSDSDESKNNLYKILGYFVIIITFLGFLVMTGGFLYSQFHKVGVVYCEFSYIGDVKFDDSFTLNGSKVGMVKGITSNEPERVIVKIHLKSPVEIHEGYKLFIGDVGIMGERVICVENGQQDAPVINSADTLKGKYYPGISDMLGKMYELRKFLDDCIILVNNIQHGTDTSISIIEWINSAQESIDKLSLATQNTLWNWDKDLPDILLHINDFSDTLNKDLTSFGKKLPDIIEKTDVIIDNCDTLLIKIAKIENFGNNVENFIALTDSIDINLINNTLHDLQGQISSISREAHKLRLLLMKDRKKE
jgi:ABC-type transporter Mla subunit MlaD